MVCKAQFFIIKINQKFTLTTLEIFLIMYKLSNLVSKVKKKIKKFENQIYLHLK